MTDTTSSWAQKGASVLDKAKEEGKVVWYVSVNLNVAMAVANGFEKKYPGIKVEVFRSNSDGQLTRVLSEFANKRYLADVISMNVMNTHLVKSKGILVQYFSPEMKAYPEGFKDPEGYWTSDHFNAYVVGYNTKMIPPSEVPKTWEDLLHPRLRRKVSADATKAQWFITQLERMGEDKGMAYMKKLSEQQVIRLQGMNIAAQLVSAGEHSLTLFVNLARVEEFKRHGAPIQPVIASTDCSAIAFHAPRPNAARIFIDYILSAEGQAIIGRSNSTPSRPNAPHLNFDELSKYELLPTKPVNPATYKKMFDQYRKTFRF